MAHADELRKRIGETNAQIQRAVDIVNDVSPDGMPSGEVNHAQVMHWLWKAAHQLGDEDPGALRYADELELELHVASFSFDGVGDHSMDVYPDGSIAYHRLGEDDTVHAWIGDWAYEHGYEHMSCYLDDYLIPQWIRFEEDGKIFANYVR